MARKERQRDGNKILAVIREEILRLELRPGSVIDEAALSASLKVSRTPIREAIIQLIASGLVIRDGRSARVAPVDFDDLPRLYDALLISSRMIHRLAAENRTPADLKKIHAAMLAFEEGTPSGDGFRRSELNVAFHMEIAAAARNGYFYDFYERVLLSTLRVQRACFSSPRGNEFTAISADDDTETHMRLTMQHHRDMYTAIEGRDIEASDRLAILHEEASKARLQRRLFRINKALPLELDLKLKRAPQLAKL